MKHLIIGLLMVFTTLTASAQITGKVVDATTKEVLPGAAILIKGSQTGSVTDIDGSFSISAKEGTILVVSYLGYETQEVKATPKLVIKLTGTGVSLSEVVVTSGVIDIAKVRETPVAVSTISPAEISLKVGNLEFPEVMNRTPGVYATKQGGGYGDSRISLRGFDQRNTSFLINGQPVNDMENGWVYWSNWQGLTDVASGIQIQREV